MSKIGDIIALIKQLVEVKFYGELVIKFQNGEIVHGTKTESLSFLKKVEKNEKST